MTGAQPPASLRCSGCGTAVPLDAPRPFSCPTARDGDDIDHVVVRHLDPSVPFPEAPHQNPYLAYRERFAATHLGRQHGLPDARLDGLTKRLDDAIAQVDGHGFQTTPLLPARALAERLDLPDVELWVKDETGNVSGSHKARHLMGVMHHLDVLRATGLLGRGPRPDLAIASCGNAALAAAVVANAAAWPLQVFVPDDANPRVLDRLRHLDAEVRICQRDGERGDPCIRAFRSAVAGGALPFSVQGPDNGLAVEGGQTLGYELARQLRQGPGRIDRLLVQVGGGALASACVAALREAVAHGVLPHMPRICAVQTRAAHPLALAYGRVVDRLLTSAPGPAPRSADARADWLRTALGTTAIDAALRHAASHRSAFMRPWPSPPQSLAHGILDDETYDWRAVVEAMLRTAGYPLMVEESDLEAAKTAVRAALGVGVSYTGAAGVAGLCPLRRDDVPMHGEVVVALLTGRQR